LPAKISDIYRSGPRPQSVGVFCCEKSPIAPKHQNFRERTLRPEGAKALSPGFQPMSANLINEAVIFSAEGAWSLDIFLCVFPIARRAKTE
jgi:hypothetical protein